MLTHIMTKDFMVCTDTPRKTVFLMRPAAIATHWNSHAVHSMWHTQYSWKVSDNSELHEVENFRMCKRPGKDDIRTPQEWANFMWCNGNASPREVRDGIFIQYNQHSIINHDVSVFSWGIESGTKCCVLRDSWRQPSGEKDWLKLLKSA